MSVTPAAKPATPPTAPVSPTAAPSTHRIVANNVSRHSSLWCCFPWLLGQNKVRPSEFSMDICEFMDVGPGRRLRIVHLDPSQQGYETSFVSKDGRKSMEEVSIHSEDSSEEYWFRNWARPRLPVKDGQEEGERDTLVEEEICETLPKTPASEDFELFVTGLVLKVIEESMVEGTRIIHERSSEKIASEESHDSGLATLDGYTNYGYAEDEAEKCTCESLDQLDATAPSETMEPLYEVKEPSPSEATLEADQTPNPVTIVVEDHSEKPASVPDPTQYPGGVSSQTCEPSSMTSDSSRLKPKPILIFLHGVGSSADAWHSQLLYFASVGYEVVAPDILGHGFSSAPGSAKAYKFSRLLSDLEAVVDRYVPEGRKCVVVGHSYGSSFAAALARRRPQSVSSLVMVSSGGPAPLAPPRSAFMSLPVWMLGCVKPFLACGFRREAFYSPRGKQLKFQESFDVPPYVLRNMIKGQDWPEGDAAFHRRISSPTLLVYGMKDPFVTLVEECEMEKTLPKAFLEVIPRAGHMVMLEAPRQLSHMIHKFILCWDGS